MNTYKRTFPRGNTFLPVIHVEWPAQAIRNANIAFGEGADGVFLINHKVPASHLRQCYRLVRERYKNKWIGINWLDMAPTEGIAMMESSISGMWVDNAGVHEDHRGDMEARVLARMHRNLESEWKTSFLLFGGVAFKYQNPVQDLEWVARTATLHIDVITTSGTRTGSAPSIEKIQAIRKAVGDDFPLAIASGITPGNVREYMPYVDCFLVATGISKSHTEFNPALVREFAKVLS